MKDHELCKLHDTIIDYYVVPFTAAILFLLMAHPITVNWFKKYIPSGFWLYFFGATIVFFAVFITEIVIKRWRKSRSTMCIDSGTLTSV